MKYLCYMLILVVFPLFFVSCSKEDEGDSTEEKGEILINGEKYVLNKGGIWYFMEHPDNVYNFYIELISPGIMGNAEDGYTGQGELVSLVLLSQNWNLPDPGTYSIVVEEDEGNSGNAFLEIYSGFHLEGNEEVAEQYYVCISGNVVFNKTGDEYEFTVSAIGYKLDFDTDNILEEDIEINLSYKGNLIEDLLDEEP